MLLAACTQLGSVIAFFSDCQSVHKVHSEVVSQIAQHQPSTVFIGGDITQKGTLKEDYERFFEVMQPLTESAEIFPAVGNHDRDTELFLTNFPQVDSLTYYSVERESIVWIVLNSNLKLAPGSAQYNWLAQTLEANQNRTVVIVMHHPVYSSGPYGDGKGFSNLFPALLKLYNVAAVLSGHDHLYERSSRDGIEYVVFGGGGARLHGKQNKNDYSVVFRKTHGFLIFEREDVMMRVTAYDIRGSAIDSFSFAIKSAAATDTQEQSR